MEDYDYRRSTSTRRSSGRTFSGNKKAAPGSSGLLGIQTVVCVLCIGAALLIRFTGGPAYAAAKNIASGIVHKNVTIKDVSAAYCNFKKSFTSTVAVFNGIRSTASSSHAVSSGSQAASSGNSMSQASSKSSASLNSYSGTASFVAGSSSVRLGSGGKDLNTFNDAPSLVSTLLPPKNATVAPVKLSVRPILPITGRITSKFGWRIHPITKKLSFHTGVDIANSQGTPIAAALPGKVQAVGTNDAYGNYVLMDNGGDVTTFYGHCLEIVAPQGAVLRAGDIIAKVGSTGWSTGPHLHFEIRVNNIYTNPLWVLNISGLSV